MALSGIRITGYLLSKTKQRKMEFSTLNNVGHYDCCCKFVIMTMRSETILIFERGKALRVTTVL